MRNLAITDVFRFCRLIRELNIIEDVRKITGSIASTEGMTQGEAGSEIIFGLIEACTTEEAELKLYGFFSGLFEMPVEEIMYMEPLKFVETVLDCANVNEWASFFSSVSKRLLKKSMTESTHATMASAT